MKPPNLKAARWFGWLPTASIAGFCLAISWGQVRAEPVTNLYAIVAGEYIACCGIAGALHRPLPYVDQTHVLLVTDATQQTAQLTILSDLGGSPVFQVLANGVLRPDYIEFGLPGPPPGPGLPWQHYIVSNSAAGLRFHGVMLTGQQGADVFNRFTHTNVVANLAAATSVPATIRASAVEVCWESVVNRSYQVQYRTAVDTGEWINLGDPVPGDGGTRCVTDQIAAGQPRRFYRIVPVP